MAHPPPPAPLALREKLSGVRSPLHIERIERAWKKAEELYAGLLHRSGVPLATHVRDVLDMLLQFEPDEDTMIACILHHALESKQITIMDLAEQFGSKVRSMVSAVHLLSHVTLERRRNSVEDLRLMFMSVADDIRAVLIILCDRTWAAEHIQLFAEEERRGICQDVLQLFAPVAARLGIHSLKQRMECYAFPVLYPADAEHIAEQLKDAHEKYSDFLPGAAEALCSALQSEGITAEVTGREKQSYSIFLKMRTKSVTHVDRLHDLFALRVIVHSTEQCYTVLGILHRWGRPFANRFKDFIAFPKPNGYQSLHTTLAKLPGVPDGVSVEVQVRTAAMHREAEFGIAAHWSYKEGGTTDHAASRAQLQNVLAEQHSIDNGSEHEAALADHIYVLTPKGDIIELPEGATPLDFAFQIHTDLGLSFRSARVNGSIVPLEYELENGDVIEIHKSKTPQPSPEWMQLVRMASSRNRLKRYLYSLQREPLVAAGKVLLNVELLRRKQPPIDERLSLLKFFDGRALSVTDREDILFKIGQGSEKAAVLLPHLDALRGKDLAVLDTRKKRTRMQRKDSLVEVEGNVQMPMRFAGCCKPQEHQEKPIVGVITRTGSVTIHRDVCRMVKSANPERKVTVRWR